MLSVAAVDWFYVDHPSTSHPFSTVLVVTSGLRMVFFICVDVHRVVNILAICTVC